MTNVFRISPELGPEDRFTAHLQYLLDCLPEIGQVWADYLLTQAGKAASRFVRAVDHPPSSFEDRPDFLLECEDVDIVCEHKLGSALGRRQLERYLVLPSSRPSYVTLISSGILAVPEEVRASAWYLAPTGDGLVHYRWDELYPLIASRPERLARDFAEYMDELGMRPLSAGSWSDLFRSRSRAEEFAEQLRLVISHFKQIGAVCSLDQGRLGLKIQRPERWLPLMHLGASRTVNAPEPALGGPYLRAAMYVYASDPRRQAFEVPATRLEFGGGTILSRPANEVASWSPDRIWVRQYLTSLESVLSADAVVMRDRLREFAIRAFEDMRTLRGAGDTE